MFNIFDILVPSLEVSSGVVRHRETSAFGPVEGETAIFGNVTLGTIQIACDEYSPDGLEYWTQSTSRAQWTVIRSAGAASHHAQRATWATFVDGVVAVLSSCDDWLVTCERDCDQHPIEEIVATPLELADRLRTTAEEPDSFLAFRVRPPRR